MQIEVKVRLPISMSNKKEVVHFARIVNFPASVLFPYEQIASSLHFLFQSIPHEISFNLVYGNKLL